MSDLSILEKLPSFAGISIDSRTIRQGDCFFAIKGENFDGHDYIEDVFAKGAVCAVVSRASCLRIEGETPSTRRATRHERHILRVDDTIKALGILAKEYRKKAGYKVVAITGSVGKTTTRQITHHVLSKHFKVHQSPKSFNNNIGLPLTLLNAPKETEIVIAELGTNNPGEISYLTQIACPDIAIVINVHPAHLEGFGELQAIVKEKVSIYEGLSKNGIFIINSDFQQIVNYCKQKEIDFISFGKSESSDNHIKNIHLEGSRSKFEIENTEIELPLPGAGNVENALASWVICKQFGISIADFNMAIKDIIGTSMRAEVLQIGTLTVLNDCYNANPASMKNALEILTKIDETKKRRLVFICGDMAELGTQSENLHIELGNTIAQAGIDLVIAVGKFAKIAAQVAMKNTKKEFQIKCFNDTLSACNKLHEFIKDYDIILVKGSRTAKLEAALEKLKGNFS